MEKLLDNEKIIKNLKHTALRHVYADPAFHRACLRRAVEIKNGKAYYG